MPKKVMISELRMIKIGDVDFENKTIKVTGKGRRERYVPIEVHTRRHIIRYIRGARPKLCPENSPYLFANSDGEPITEWTEQNVKMATDGFGWGHNKCWNSNIGQLRKIAKLTKKIYGES